VLTRAVTERRREIGIRLALGATPGSISRIVRADGIRMLVTGATLGLAAGWWLARYLQAHLYGVDPLDAVSVAVTLGLVTVVALSSSAIPARRASTLDPADVLRPH
jgi:ABC-type lipoprotein release transport system permease subunit